jgi:hypothetical protein
MTTLLPDCPGKEGIKPKNYYMKKHSTNYAIKMLGFTVIAFMAMLKPAFCQVSRTQNQVSGPAKPEIWYNWSTSDSAFSQKAAVDNDLLTYSMAVSKDQQVKFRFPLDMRSGDRITGTVVEEQKSNAGAVNNASSSLSGVVIEIDGKQTKLSNRLFSFIVPAGITSLPFLLKNSAGEIIEQGQIPLNLPTTYNWPWETGPEMSVLNNNGANFKPNAICQPGLPLTISGNFDGNASNTNVSIGGQPCEVIAEAGNMTIVQVPQNATAGVTNISINENNVTEEHQVNVAVLNLTTNKTTLRKGEKATVSVSVSGLQGLETGNECKVRIANLSPTVVSMKGTSENTFSETIPQGLTADYKSTFNIVGITQGNFMLEGVLFCKPAQNNKANETVPDGPQYKAWQQRYRDSIGKRLREEGFTPGEIKGMINDSFSKTGIIKNLWRLYKMWRAIRNARKDVGDPPDRTK